MKTLTQAFLFITTLYLTGCVEEFYGENARGIMTLSGVVRDTLTHQPLSGVRVYYREAYFDYSTSWEGVTDQQGRYTIHISPTRRPFWGSSLNAWREDYLFFTCNYFVDNSHQVNLWLKRYAHLEFSAKNIMPFDEQDILVIERKQKFTNLYNETNWYTSYSLSLSGTQIDTTFSFQVLPYKRDTLYLTVTKNLEVKHSKYPLYLESGETAEFSFEY